MVNSHYSTGLSKNTCYVDSHPFGMAHSSSSYLHNIIKSTCNSNRIYTTTRLLKKKSVPADEINSQLIVIVFKIPGIAICRGVRVRLYFDLKNQHGRRHNLCLVRKYNKFVKTKSTQVWFIFWSRGKVQPWLAPVFP